MSAEWQRAADALVKLSDEMAGLSTACGLWIDPPELLKRLNAIGELHDIALEAFRAVPEGERPGLQVITCGQWDGISWAEIVIAAGWTIREMMPTDESRSKLWGLSNTLTKIHNQLRVEVKSHKVVTEAIAEPKSADISADTPKIKSPISPDISAFIAYLKRVKPAKGKEAASAREFCEKNDLPVSKAANLLRGARRYPSLW